LLILSIKTVIAKKTIPKIIFLIKKRIAPALLILAKLGVIKARANEPAERFIESVEKAFNHGLLKIISMGWNFITKITILSQLTKFH